MSQTPEEHAVEEEDWGDSEIPRKETGLRILMTLLFVVIGSVLETIIAVIVLFELIATLITQRAPGLRVREFANRIISYYYKLGRYMTYNESCPPFPFTDFPEALEGDAFDPLEVPSTSLGVRRQERDEEDVQDEEESY